MHITLGAIYTTLVDPYYPFLNEIMAQLQRHGSLRFSVFEAAVEIGLGPRALDGYIDTIAEEDEPEVCTSNLFVPQSFSSLV